MSEEKESKMETEAEEKKPSLENKEKESSSGSVDIPEEAQKAISSLIEQHKDNRPTLEHIRGKAQDAIDDHRKREREKEDAERMKKMPKGKRGVPSSYSLADAPSDVY